MTSDYLALASDGVKYTPVAEGENADWQRVVKYVLDDLICLRTNFLRILQRKHAEKKETILYYSCTLYITIDHQQNDHVPKFFHSLTLMIMIMKTRCLYWVECPQYSIRFEVLGYCAQAVYFLHSTRPSVT